MIHPTNLDTLTSVLKPPKGYLFDYGVFTTYSLHLDLILTLPMYLTNANNNSIISTENYGHIVDMINIYKDKMKVFVQAGEIKTSSLARGKSSKLYTLLNDVIIEVESSKSKVQTSFHPKFWLLKYTADDKIIYRLVILSKNLTNSKDWDIVASFDGEVTEPLEDDINQNIIKFLNYLGEKSPLSFDNQEIKSIKWDKDLNGLSLDNIIFLGIDDDYAKKDIEDIKQKSQIIFSPFFTKSIVDKENLKLITREGEIKERFQNLSEIYALAFDPVQVQYNDRVKQLSADLHAKIYIFQHNSTYLYMGSSNASINGLDNRNIEVLIKLKGSRNVYKDIKEQYFGDKSKLLVRIEVESIPDEVLADRALQEEIQSELREVKELILKSIFELKYVNESLFLNNNTLSILDGFRLDISPVSFIDRYETYDNEIIWKDVKIIDFTPFFYFSLKYKGAKLEFVLKFDIEPISKEHIEEIKSYADKHSSKFFIDNIKSLLATNNLVFENQDQEDSLNIKDEDKEEKLYFQKKNIKDDILDLLMLTYGTNQDTFCTVVKKILDYKKFDKVLAKEFKQLKSILKNLGKNLCKK